MEEIIITPILTRGKTIELFVLSKAFKKNTKEKKLGMPKTIPQKRLLNCKGFFDLIDFPCAVGEHMI